MMRIEQNYAYVNSYFRSVSSCKTVLTFFANVSAPAAVTFVLLMSR